MHQALTFFLADAPSEVLPDALACLITGISGDEMIASSPTAPVDRLVNSRLFKPLPLHGTQTSPFRQQKLPVVVSQRPGQHSTYR